MKMKSANTAITVLISFILIFTIAAGVTWVSSNTRKTVFKEVQSAMHNAVEQNMAALGNYISQTGSMAHMLASQQAVRDALEGRDALSADWLFKDLLASSDNYWAAFAFDKRGIVVAGCNAKGQNMAGADRSTRAYAKAVLGGKVDTFLSDEILISKSGGGIMIFATASAVRDHAGEVIGGVGLFPKWDAFTSKFIDPIRVAGEGYGFMLDAKGRIIAHAMDKELYLKDLSDMEFVKTAMTERKGGTAYEWNGRMKYMVFDTLPDMNWTMVMSAYEDDMGAAAAKQRNQLAVGGAVVCLLLIGVMVFIIRKLVTNPVRNILNFASEVADGNLNAELTGSYRFEFKGLSGQIDIMVDELKSKLGFSEGVLKGVVLPCGLTGPDFRMLWVNEPLLRLLEWDGSPEDYVGMPASEFYYRDADRETMTQRAIGENRSLSDEIGYTTPSGRELVLAMTATPFHDMDGRLLGSLTLLIDMTEIRAQQNRIEEQNERISQTAAMAEEISQSLSKAADDLFSQIELASHGAERQRERATETAAAMEEMNATVLEVARNASQAAEDSDTARRNAQDGERIVGQVVDAVGDVQAQADNLKVSMEDLGQRAGEIGKVMEVITDIADQTNLLALNAAIEAARAGEAGRGFAVVADEVRKLAEKTMAATREVGDAIGRIQAMTRDSIKATEAAVASVSRSTGLAEDSGRALQEIVGNVENAFDQVRTIAAASEQQSATSEEINRATEEVNAISQETSQVMREASEAIRGIADMAGRLNSVIEQMSA
ncbi:MAG: methyl-accepting chemotaxis protein [Pseudodesulfovibrio sp.]|uniref:methyl-accepting chemotaxis protein n=1 Tax=Pseudodesulfovibrio sp. TaxID=2035812 RepID=UPI003D0DF64D